MVNYTPLRSTPGAITAPGVEPLYAAAVLADDSESEVRIVTGEGYESIKVARIDQDANSDRLVLVTKKIKYNWRPLREADGIWISKLRIPLPVEAIPGIATGDPMETELLSAFTSGDSPYVLGVVYETADGQWVRSGGQFLPIAGDDTTYSDMDRIIIDPARAQAFLDLYDKNYVTVSDATGFESAAAE